MKKILNLSPEDKKRLNQAYSSLTDASKRFLGYPMSMAYDCAETERFLQFPLNNCGDPFNTHTIYKINTHEFEREVLDFFADLYHIPREKYWGYVAHGGTEGNMYGLYLAREACPGGIVYFSEDTHYSVPKIVRVLGMTHIIIRSQKNGEINYEDLRSVLREHRDKPAIILANIGTTMRGASDQIEKIQWTLRENAILRSYIHCDAALGGLLLPFVQDAPIFDFRSGVDSIAVSGHKMIGMPFPSGIVIVKKHNMERVRAAIEYIGTSDTTISGSRNGLAPLMLWIAIRSLGRKGFEDRAAYCLSLTQYALEKFKKAGWSAWANNHCNTIVIKRPPEKVIKKWQLAVQGDIAHIILMPHTKKRQVDGLATDLKKISLESTDKVQ